MILELKLRTLIPWFPVCSDLRDLSFRVPSSLGLWESYQESVEPGKLCIHSGCFHAHSHPALGRGADEEIRKRGIWDGLRAGQSSALWSQGQANSPNQ